MQRIQSWFDQLTIGRQSRRNNTRRGRKNTESVDRGPKSTNHRIRAASHSVVRESRDQLGPMPGLLPPPPSAIQNMGNPSNHMMNGSFPRRNRIRTNPWIGESKMWDSMMSTSSMGRSQPSKNLPAGLSVVSPDTSMCSSGYGSHDSSPDTSMVWTNEWKSYDNSNIYHELMSTSKLSDSSCSITNGNHSLVATPSPKHERVDSPIYAEPWTQYPTHLSPTPLILQNCNYRPASPIYSQPFSDTYRRVLPRNPPPIYARQNEMMEDEELATDQFLHELDHQIYQLQMRSEELREMVERARHQRKEFIIPKMECTFELAL